MKVSFPSAKDPSWFDRYGSISTCVVTIEADDEFVRMFDTKPRIYSYLKPPGDTTLGQRVIKDLCMTFPQLNGEGCVTSGNIDFLLFRLKIYLLLFYFSQQAKLNASKYQVRIDPASCKTQLDLQSRAIVLRRHTRVCSLAEQS